MFNKTKKTMLEWLGFKISEPSEKDVVLRAPRTPLLTEEEHTIISYVEEHLFTYHVGDEGGVKIDTSKWDVEYDKDDFFQSSNWDTPVQCHVVNISSLTIPHLSFKLYIPSLVVKTEGLVGGYPLMVECCSLISSDKLSCLTNAINKSKNEKLGIHVICKTRRIE